MNERNTGIEHMNMQEFRCGLKDGAPIAAGYLSVSFSFGIMVLGGGLSIFQGALMSLTNMTSAGQFAGLQVIIAGGTLLEMAVTQFIINLRYALMSLSLSQKLSDAVTFRERLVIAFANTDEIFAVAVGRGKSLTFSYMLGLQLLPVLGWTSGTVLGAAASGLMPPALGSALNVALYGMFIAVVAPNARKSRAVLFAAALAAAISCMIYYVPALSGISSGTAIILSTVAASAAAAFLFPVREQGETEA